MPVPMPTPAGPSPSNSDRSSCSSSLPSSTSPTRVEPLEGPAPAASIFVPVHKQRLGGHTGLRDVRLLLWDDERVMLCGRTFAQGGAGKVRMAVDVHSGDFMALKAFRCTPRPGPPRSGGPRANISPRYVVREYERAQQHGGPLAPLGAYEVVGRGKVGYAMPAMDGDVLRLARHTPATLLAALGLETLWQATEQLEPLHRRGLVHADIKLNNLLFGRAGQICIADLGEVLQLGTQRHVDLAARVGTYPDPEALRDLRYSCGTDVWALGLALWDLCAPRLPVSDVLGMRFYLPDAAVRAEGYLAWRRSLLRGEAAAEPASDPRDLAGWLHASWRAFSAIHAPLARLVVQSMMAPARERLSVPALRREAVATLGPRQAEGHEALAAHMAEVADALEPERHRRLLQTARGKVLTALRASEGPTPIQQDPPPAPASASASATASSVAPPCLARARAYAGPLTA
jgi:serine/threonine protein kinase